MLLKRIYFSVNKFPDFLVSSLMVFFLLFDVAREAFERHLLSSNRRRFATIKLVLSLSWLFSFCGFFVGVAPFMEFNLTSSYFQLDVNLTLANFRSSVREWLKSKDENVNKPSQLCFVPRIRVWWVVGRVEFGSVSS